MSTASLDALVARQEIVDVILRFARAADRADVEMMRSCFHEDSTDHHGAFYCGDGRGFADLMGRDSPYKMTSHFVFNILIEFDGNLAHGETYFLSYARREDDSGKWDELVGGRYVDLFARREGRWAFAKRTVVYDWARTDAAGQGKPFWEHFKAEPGAFPFGTKGAADPLYTLYEDELKGRFPKRKGAV